MATSTSKPKTTDIDTANTAVKHEGDHDRVQMLSLRADGTPDQHNPEIIGDKEAAVKAAQEQFKQQAVSAADAKNAGDGGSTVEDAPQDPTIEAAKAEHDKVAAAAEKAAEKVVSALHEG
ncbi:hypothetical protein ASE01_20075 [Nocardioides sp. Root190]|uniref:hypothetical protein n=1 Tax=Nocardioides sp. Root190 TaxID=1736488 RepID=UPI0006FC4481|nr:hypothetical protein [Nocardioides sp. Root190]KRB73075.1 hypothetical protein ASE01_20075 [Nocardioides sp. Root190]